ncbi:hypothetical protein [Pedobacter flavus]|uniref:Uncharacterized protein n=1 Tax=Pedobacter flavus TaxID=3113906 RepID=A0ABU7H006_9SPHI|nr:hypothetical protein [Pedobacter sp. VNH31]MEE1884363.1 hypothetical protein [Pedobacter sp. VNH31]
MKNSLELMALYSERVKELNHFNAVCEGFYKIQDVIDFSVNKGYMNLRVYALWHPTDKTFEGIFYPLNISLNGLFVKQSTGPKEVSFNGLIGGIIEVTKVEVFDYEYNSLMKKSLKADWHIVAFPKDITG